MSVQGIRRNEIEVNLQKNGIKAKTELAKSLLLVMKLQGDFPEGTRVEDGVATFPPAFNVIEVMAELEPKLFPAHS